MARKSKKLSKTRRGAAPKKHPVVLRSKKNTFSTETLCVYVLVNWINAAPFHLHTQLHSAPERSQEIVDVTFVEVVPHFLAHFPLFLGRVGVLLRHLVPQLRPQVLDGRKVRRAWRPLLVLGVVVAPEGLKLVLAEPIRHGVSAVSSRAVLLPRVLGRPVRLAQSRLQLVKVHCFTNIPSAEL